MAYLPALITPSEEHQNPSSMTPVMPPPAMPAKRKRPRAARACEFCREKKYRCDERTPCIRCKKQNRPCIYKDADLARERFSDGVGQAVAAASPSSSRTVFDTSHTRRQEDYLNTDDDVNEEVSEVNQHTRDTEFHGPTSSLAFLAAVQQHPDTDGSQTGGSISQSLVSAFHNDSFSPPIARSTPTDNQALSSNRHYFRQSRFFLDGYFQNLHFIHPIIDRTDFYARCEDLWFDRSEKQNPSFIALYYAVMGLGAIVQEWDEETIDGRGRFDWARKMFYLASDALGPTMRQSDLHTVQACIIMAKVCQNELNPNLAYSFLGRAVRTALSAGFNRRSRSNGMQEEHVIIARTWWGLYSLEVELSFALGRPDSLGLDIYHNQLMPPIDDTEHAILATMVDFARMIREVSISIYASAQSIADRLIKASEIEQRMDTWVTSLPDAIRPNIYDEDTPSMTKEARWAKKQKHTLKFRYFNVKMVLYRPFLLHAAATGNPPDVALQAAVKKCVSSAKATIQLMHRMYCDLTYFRTWWYNVTYTLYGASIIVCYLSRLAGDQERDDLQRHIDMSLDVLNAMKEHTVAAKARTILQQAVHHSREQERPATIVPHWSRQTNQTPLMQLASVSAEASEAPPPEDIFLDPFHDTHLDFMCQLFPFEDNYLSPWPS